MGVLARLAALTAALALASAPAAGIPSARAGGRPSYAAGRGAEEVGQENLPAAGA